MPKPKRNEEGVSRRACRACGETYSYPDVRSAATRVHCADCAGLPKPIRVRFEVLTRRIRRLEKQLAKVTKPATQ